MLPLSISLPPEARHRLAAWLTRIETLKRNSTARSRSSGLPIYVSAVIDSDYANEHFLFHYFINDAEFTSSGGIQAFESTPQGFANAKRILGKGSSNELPACYCRNFREIRLECSSCGSCQFDAIGQRGSRPASRIA